MKMINVYGSGCKNCTATAELIKETARQLKIEIKLSKVSDLQAIMEAGVISTPAVSVDGKLVHSGSVPDLQTVKVFLS
ncbi:thioredoxin family protein [Psychromonas antarctica]|uniref:thioredoxin family protein n=1 Tax=Psychromonas antarctica TaxID=67573 RepID=UPI001EE89C66|nr:thioredoxin family protein [Psychromonas antarctica]MCG6202544.1 thioredoxin family protein [Psychromonas antarctica]